MADSSSSDWLDQIVLINSDGIYFGATKVPGLIAEDGIEVTPDANGVNRLRVEFLVGRVLVQDYTSDTSTRR